MVLKQTCVIVDHDDLEWFKENGISLSHLLRKWIKNFRERYEKLNLGELKEG